MEFPYENCFAITANNINEFFANVPIRWKTVSINLHDDFKPIQHNGLEYYQISNLLVDIVDATLQTPTMDHHSKQHLWVYVRDNVLLQCQAQDTFLSDKRTHLMYINGAYGVGKTRQTFVTIMKYLQRHPYNTTQVMWMRYNEHYKSFDVTIFGLPFDDNNLLSVTYADNLSGTSYSKALEALLTSLPQWKQQMNLIVMDQMNNGQASHYAEQVYYSTPRTGLFHYSPYLQSIVDKTKVIVITSINTFHRSSKLAYTSFEVNGWTLQEYQQAMQYNPLYERIQSKLSSPDVEALIHVPGILSDATTILSEVAHQSRVKDRLIQAKFHLVGACATHMFAMDTSCFMQNEDKYVDCYERIFHSLSSANPTVLEMIQNMLTDDRNEKLYHRFLIPPIAEQLQEHQTFDGRRDWSMSFRGHFFISGYVARRLAISISTKFDLLPTMIQYALELYQCAVKYINRVNTSTSKDEHSNNRMLLNVVDMNQTIFQMEFLSKWN